MSEKNETDQFNKHAGNLSLEFDPSTFMHFLDGADWSEEEKAEYLAIVWEIVCEFVALGFNVHPLQQAQKACGKLPESGALGVEPQ